MKIVVIGGTGLIGSKLVKKLRADGHDPLAASPNTGVDIITGKGLAEALQGAQVVVDVSNAPDWGDAAVMDFFQTATRNIIAAEAAARAAPDGNTLLMNNNGMTISSILRKVSYDPRASFEPICKLGSSCARSPRIVRSERWRSLRTASRSRQPGARRA